MRDEGWRNGAASTSGNQFRRVQIGARCPTLPEVRAILQPDAPIARAAHPPNCAPNMRHLERDDRRIDLGPFTTILASIQADQTMALRDARDR